MEEKSIARLDGATVLVAGHPSQLSTTLAAGLSELGATVGLLGTPAGGAAQSVAGSIASREEAIEAVAGAREALGALDAVVYVPTVLPGLEDRLLADTSEDDWDRGAEAPIRTAYFVIQGAHESFAERGGSIVAVIPSIALTGAAGLVPFATAAEGIRLLAKSAARAWGKRRVTVNSVTVPIEAWGYSQSREHRVPNRYGPSMADSDLSADISGAVGLMATSLASGVTGATIGVDQGTVMAP